MTASDDPLDRLLDLALYAPVGLALAARDLLPELADRGRRQLEARFAAAGMVGRLAVKEATRQADHGLRRIADQGQAFLRGAGLAPRPPVEDMGGPTAAAVHDPTASAPAEPPAAEASAGLDAAALAIPGYDTLSASQVVQRLAGLSVEELDAVRTYEASTRGRRTILSKIAQLQAGPPA